MSFYKFLIWYNVISLIYQGILYHWNNFDYDEPKIKSTHKRNYVRINEHNARTRNIMINSPSQYNFLLFEREKHNEYMMMKIHNQRNLHRLNDTKPHHIKIHHLKNVDIPTQAVTQAIKHWITQALLIINRIFMCFHVFCMKLPCIIEQ